MEAVGHPPVCLEPYLPRCHPSCPCGAFIVSTRPKGLLLRCVLCYGWNAITYEALTTELWTTLVGGPGEIN
jgi:hypothetical protein